MTEPRLSRLRARLEAPVDIASLAMHRILFGLLMFAGTVRFASAGWIETQLAGPRFHFKYWGFEWVPVPPSPWLQLEFGLLALLALAVAAGLFYRLAMPAFTLVFTHVQLMDLTNYLNHYWFVVLLSALMCALPLHAAWSLDAWRDRSLARATVPAWMPALLRFQVGLLYGFAAVAKLTPDWLLHAQPLQIWLGSRTDLPVLGALFAQPWTPWVFAWGGLLYDATIVVWLLIPGTRPFAYLAVLGFHACTHLLFDIGLFPFIMTLSTLLFFAPDWPRRLLRIVSKQAVSEPALRPPRWVPWAIGAYAAVMLVVPLRFLAYGGDVLWHEQGMRFSWRVMVREKSGSVAFQVRDPASGRRWEVEPSRYLSPRQEREMSTQPDLVLQLAHRIVSDFKEMGYPAVEVRADARVSLNGRPPAPMIDPTVDLARVSDGLAKATWILPAPETRPLTRPTLASRR
jgi:hypothetical protein